MDTERQMRIKRKRAARRRRNIRLAVLILFIIAAIAAVIILVKKMNEDDNIPDNPPTASNPSDTEPHTSSTSEPDTPQTQEPQTGSQQGGSQTPETEPVQTEQPQTNGSAEGFSRSDWNLILVNPDNYIPDGYGDSVKLAVAQVNYTGTYKVDERIVDDLKAMLAAAEQDGIELVLRSSFRTNERQRELYNNRVAILEGKGYSHEEALKVAATINAIPGTSEHETGLAVDILTEDYPSLDSGFDQTEAFEWLTQHCTEFGFIMRYPEDKIDITGIIYEPWHYRYVGKENAKRIKELGVTFEEYYEMLQP